MGKPKMPKNMAFDPIEMIDKQAEVNRIGEENPYGSATYVTQPDGTQKLVKSFSPEMEEIHKAQIERTKQGSIKNPLDALKGAGGEGLMGLAGAMMGKLSDRYGSDSLHLNEEGESTAKGAKPTTPPETLPPAEGGGRQPVGASFPDTPMNEMSTAQQVRELDERRKLQEAMMRAQGASAQPQNVA